MDSIIWIVIGSCTLLNIIIQVIIGVAKNKKDSNTQVESERTNLQEHNPENKGHFQFLTWIIASAFILILVVIVAVRYGGSINPVVRWILVCMTTLMAIFGSTNEFADYRIINQILRSSSKGALRINALFLYVNAISVLMLIFGNNFMRAFHNIDGDGIKVHILLLMYYAFIMFIASSMIICIIVEISYLLAPYNSIIDDFFHELRRQIHSGIPSIKKELECTFCRRSEHVEYFVKDVIYKFFSSLILFAALSVFSVYALIRAIIKTVLQFFSIQFDSNKQTIGSSKCLNLLLSWSLIISLIVNYFWARYGIESPQIVVDAYFAIMSLIIFPITVGTVVSHGKR